VKQKDIIQSFVQLGSLMVALADESEWSGFSIGVTDGEYAGLQNTINKQVIYNGWFTPENVRNSLLAIGERLNEVELNQWVSDYAYADEPKNVGIIMAGNIPLVGFHDFLCTIISGNSVTCKLSSDDKHLLPALTKPLIEFLPELKQRITFSEGYIGKVDAIIATGSDNSSTYFIKYFGKYPHIFRKNRSSLAVLTGNESKENIAKLGADIFSYYGLGCRSVSHLLLPRGFDLSRFFEGIISYSDVINNNKYGNNYDYNKAVYLLNQVELLDNNFVLIRESEELFSPLAMLHYHFYDNQKDIDSYLSVHKNNIQIVVGENYMPFGDAQCPELNDYADGLDVMKWLEKL
jgi:hypothetical protein